VSVRYVSTRGTAPELGFADVLLTGLAADGGLYVPDHWPALPASWRDAPARGYAATAVDVMWPFVEGAIDRAAFEAAVVDAYATFEHPDVVPLRDLGDGVHLLELFWGPTLAFKDVALQLVGRLFDHELTARDDHVTVLGATSGDTGSAAIEALRDRSRVDCVILHPHGRVSEVQRRQMTTVDAANVANVAIEGTFDDCQDLVKAAFADVGFRDEVHLSAVNSINWARVMAQVVYYVTACAHLGGGPVSFAVPTGNFGNIYAGWVASRMGLPIDQLVIGSNRNDILTRTFSSGRMAAEGVVPTLSPSMDIQVSSNLERLLFEVLGRDGAATADLLTRFRAEGAVELPAEQFRALSERFVAARCDDDETLAVMKDVHAAHGILVDPHTAVGIHAARTAPRRGPAVPMVVLATAHPAKFPDAVVAATGVHPELPPHLADLLERPERFTVLADDVGAVRSFIRARLAS
jgi:threonine synthase